VVFLKNFILGYPRGIESIEKVLNCEIGLQDLEKVLNLSKMYMKYWKSTEIPNFVLYRCWQFCRCFFGLVFHW